MKCQDEHHYFSVNQSFKDLLECRIGGEIMSKIQRKFVESCLLILLLITLFLLASISSTAQKPTHSPGVSNVYQHESTTLATTQVLAKSCWDASAENQQSILLEYDFHHYHHEAATL
jgi:hypothetical protein